MACGMFNCTVAGTGCQKYWRSSSERLLLHRMQDPDAAGGCSLAAAGSLHAITAEYFIDIIQGRQQETILPIYKRSRRVAAELPTCIDLDSCHVHCTSQLQHQTDQHHQQYCTSPQVASEQPRHAEHGNDRQSNEHCRAPANVQILLEEDMEHRVRIYLQTKIL